MVSQLSIIVSKELYIKDPISSELGEKILAQGLILMHEIGLEDFNFKKLSQKINSTESTIYRYFESKNQFLHSSLVVSLLLLQLFSVQLRSVGLHL